MKKLVVRVYGICFNEQQEVLVTSECWNNSPMLKFPGGGLEWGEGTIDALKREFIEELNAEIEVIEHFYTTDFYQQSAFNSEHQIIAIYYLVSIINSSNLAIQPWNQDFPKEGEVRFHWISPELLDNSFSLTFPIDQYVGLMVKQLVRR